MKDYWNISGFRMNYPYCQSAVAFSDPLNPLHMQGPSTADKSWARAREPKISTSVAREDAWYLIPQFQYVKYQSSSTGLMFTFPDEKWIFTWRYKCF